MIIAETSFTFHRIPMPKVCKKYYYCWEAPHNYVAWVGSLVFFRDHERLLDKASCQPETHSCQPGQQVATPWLFGPGPSPIEKEGGRVIKRIPQISQIRPTGLLDHFLLRGCCGETTFELPLDREKRTLASVLQEPLVVQECTSCFHRIPMSGTRCTSFFPQHVCLWVSLTPIPERQSLQGRKHSFPHPSVHQTVARRKHPWEMGWGARHLPIEVRGGVGVPPASADRSEGWGGPYNLFHTPQFHRIPMSGCKTYDYSWDALRFS